MAVLPQFHDQHAALNRAVHRWDRRTRAGQSAIWLPRAIIAALIGGIVLALLARLRPLLTPTQIALVTGALVGAAIIVCLAVIWLRRDATERMAIRYDVALGLGERISTAFDLIEGRIRSNDELTARQITDAAAWIDRAEPSHALPIRVKVGELALLVGVVGVLAALLIVPNLQADALLDNAAQAAVIEAAREELREITQGVAANPDLEGAERDALLQALADAQRALDQNNVSSEEAFAALSDVERDLSRSADDLLQRSADTQSAIDQASERLSQAMNQSPDAGSQGLSDMLNQLAQQMEQMDAAQQAAAQDALNQAAQNMPGSNPSLGQMGQMMEQAAQSMANGDSQAAQENLQQASEQANQAEQSAQQQQRAGEQTEQNAQQAQDAADQVAEQSEQNQQQQSQAPQGDPNQQQPGEQSQPGDQSQPGEGQTNPQASQADPNQSGSQPGGENPQQSQGDQAQPGDQSSGTSQQSAQPGDAPSAQSSTGDQPGAGQDQANQSSAGIGAGMGDQAADPNALQSPFLGDRVEANNNPDGGGEQDYAPVYAPSRIGGELGEDQIFLEPEDSNVPSVDGEFSANPSGESSVPYNQVFGQYSAAANEALNQNTIPLSLRDVIRNYFSSLEPRN